MGKLADALVPTGDGAKVAKKAKMETLASQKLSNNRGNRPSARLFLLLNGWLWPKKQQVLLTRA